jgi:hypothetical protein
MHFILNKDGETIRRSRNLRGLREHARKHLVESIKIYRLADERGQLNVYFSNGDHFTTAFASFGVLCGWIRTWRNAYGAELWVNGGTFGKVERDNNILKLEAR